MRMLAFEYTPTRRDYLRAYRAFYLGNWQFWLVVLVVLLPVTFCLDLAFQRGIFGGDARLLIPLLVLVFIIVYVLSLLYISPLRAASRMRKDERLRCPVAFKADPGSLRIKTKFGESTLDWADFRRYLETRDLFLLTLAANRSVFQIIPKRAFQSAADLEAFRLLLAEKGLKKQFSLLAGG
jgi:hypothetical protein